MKHSYCFVVSLSLYHVSSLMTPGNPRIKSTLSCDVWHYHSMAMQWSFSVYIIGLLPANADSILLTSWEARLHLITSRLFDHTVTRAGASSVSIYPCHVPELSSGFSSDDAQEVISFVQGVYEVAWITRWWASWCFFLTIQSVTTPGKRICVKKLFCT